MHLTTVALLLATATFAADIPKGAHALLRLVNSVSTRTAREGDYVYLRTATPIVAGGAILVPVDSYVQGIVIHSKRSGRVKGTAELGIRIETLTMPSGKVIRMTPLPTSVDSEGSDQKVVGKESQVQQGTSHGADAVRIAGPGAMGGRGWIGAGIGCVAGSALGLATVLLTRGRELYLRQCSTIDVIFDRSL